MAKSISRRRPKTRALSCSACAELRRAMAEQGKSLLELGNVLDAAVRGRLRSLVTEQDAAARLAARPAKPCERCGSEREVTFASLSTGGLIRLCCSERRSVAQQSLVASSTS